MTSLEDWSLSTLSSHIFRQQTQLHLRSGNFFGGRPSWKIAGATGFAAEKYERIKSTVTSPLYLSL